MCSFTGFGSLYLAKLGNQTKNAQGNQALNVFSDEFKKEENDLVENDFIKNICAKMQGEKPAGCLGSAGASSFFILNLGLLVLLTFTVYVY